MNNDDKRTRDLARIEEARRQAHERLALEQQRLDQRFERLQDQLIRKYGATSDSQQRIIDASLELLKQDGLSNITLRKLAATIGMKAPALYWHFKSKEDLVDYMAEAILEKEFTDLKPKPEDQTWQDWLTEQMCRLRRAMLAYPDGARVVAGAHLYPAITLAKLIEAGLASMHADGIALKTGRHIMTAATTYTFGYVIEEQAAPTAEQISEFDLAGFLGSYPNLAQSIGDHDHTLGAQENDFLIGLNYIIRGASE